MASAHPGVTTVLTWAESKNAPRNEDHWLRDVKAKLTRSPRHSKWLRRRGL